MRIILVLLATVVILLAGCKDRGTEPIVNPPSDDDLRQAVIGAWASILQPGVSQSYTSYRIYFRADGTFTDTTFGAFANSPLPNDSLLVSCSGGYSINSGVIAYSDVTFSYSNASGKPQGFEWQKLYQAPTFNGDILLLTAALVLSPEQVNTGVLPGKWATTFWYYLGLPDSLTPIYEGRKERHFIFAPDTSILTETDKYPDNPKWTGQTWTGSYQFNSPFLQFAVNGSTENVQVTLSPTRMCWLYNSFTTSLHRLK